MLAKYSIRSRWAQLEKTHYSNTAAFFIILFFIFLYVVGQVLVLLWLGPPLSRYLESELENATTEERAPYISDAALITSANETSSLPPLLVSRPARFGPRADVEGRLCLVDGGACDAFELVSYDGCVALVQRGTCSFYTKVSNLERAGAIGVIIGDNVDTKVPLLSMTKTKSETDLKIPSYFTSLGTYRQIMNLETVSVKIVPGGMVDQMKVVGVSFATVNLGFMILYLFALFYLIPTNNLGAQQPGLQLPQDEEEEYELSADHLSPPPVYRDSEESPEDYSLAGRSEPEVDAKEDRRALLKQ